MKENLKPCVYKLWNTVNGGPRTFCRTVRRVVCSGEVKRFRRGAAVKASVKSTAQSEQADPKPGDLPMSRLKLP